MSTSESRQGHDLPFPISRRRFWRALLQEVYVASGLLKGGEGCSLSELGSLPDAQLAAMRPIVHPDCQIFVDREHVWSRCSLTDTDVRLFPQKDTASSAALGMFDGQHTLREVGKRLAEAMDWDEDRAYTHARDLFLSLAGRLICIPRDALELAE